MGKCYIFLVLIFNEIDFSNTLVSFHKKQEERQLLFHFGLKTHKTIKQL